MAESKINILSMTEGELADDEANQYARVLNLREGDTEKETESAPFQGATTRMAALLRGSSFSVSGAAPFAVLVGSTVGLPPVEITSTLTTTRHWHPGVLPEQASQHLFFKRHVMDPFHHGRCLLLRNIDRPKLIVGIFYDRYGRTGCSLCAFSAAKISSGVFCLVVLRKHS